MEKQKIEYRWSCASKLEGKRILYGGIGTIEVPHGLDRGHIMARVEETVIRQTVGKIKRLVIFIERGEK